MALPTPTPTPNNQLEPCSLSEAAGGQYRVTPSEGGGIFLKPGARAKKPPLTPNTDREPKAQKAGTLPYLDFPCDWETSLSQQLSEVSWCLFKKTFPLK